MLLQQQTNSLLLPVVGVACFLTCFNPAGAQGPAKPEQAAQSPPAGGNADTNNHLFPENGNDADATRDRKDDWQAKVDLFFGQWIVRPIETVIFFGPSIESAPRAPNQQARQIRIPLVVLLLLGAGLFFTVRMAFINLRGFWHAIRLTRGDYDDPGDVGEVTHFQALSAALSATVGLGNIGGVAIAVAIGGPGASFWMILVGLLGMSTKFAECSLGQIYRKLDDRGQVLGGPMRYLRVGLSELGLAPLGAVLATVFAVLCVGASMGGGNAYQINQSLAVIRNAVPLIDEKPWLYGLVMASIVGAVIIGGIRSIGRVAAAIVPFMCAAYMLAAFYILISNFQAVPTALVSIITGAFNMDAGIGGLIGVMITGTQRAVFSNEAGVGSAPIAHSAAKTDEPISEGIVALLEPFIDTVLVCTTTALVILVAGVSTDSPSEGAALTLEAFQTGGHQWFGYILYLAVVLFAISTCISWSYYGERCFVELLGTRSSIVYKMLFVLFTFLGSVITATKVLDFSDLMIFGMAIPNLIGVFLLSGVTKRALDDYWQRYRTGQLEPPKGD